MKNRLIISALLLLIISGCGGGKAVVSRYYLLEYPRLTTLGLLAEDSLSVLGGSCFIAPVEVHPAFATHQIVVRESTNQINYCSFHEWAVRPSQSLTVFITDFFTDTGMFSSINSGRVALGNDFLLETYVSKLEVMRSKQQLLAHVELTFTLRYMRNNTVIARHHASEIKMLEEKNLNQFAAAVSRIVVEQLRIFARQIDQATHML